MLLGITACKSDEDKLINGFSSSELRALERIVEEKTAEKDASNLWDGDSTAIAFGEELFFSTALSSEEIACATCHDPEKGFSDGLPLSDGVGQTGRHAPHIYEQSTQTWFFWDGRCDSLWCQAAGPIEAGGEMDSSRTEVGFSVLEDSELKEMYENLFGALPDMSTWPRQARPDSDETSPQAEAWATMSEEEQYSATEILINAAKAIAAFEATIETPESDIDSFASLYRQDETGALESLTKAQDLGLRLFVGKGNCHFCHSGSSFTNGEFHNIGLGARDWLSDTDNGRYLGIEALQENPFNRQGIWSDSTEDQLADRISRLSQTTEQLGQFKVPSLRNVKNTAPYMHGGHFETLEEVVQFYINADETPIQGHREELLVQQDWSQEEIDALVAFLEML